jgi:hypothetical protein
MTSGDDNANWPTGFCGETGRRATTSYIVLVDLPSGNLYSWSFETGFANPLVDAVRGEEPLACADSSQCHTREYAADERSSSVDITAP